MPIEYDRGREAGRKEMLNACLEIIDMLRDRGDSDLRSVKYLIESAEFDEDGNLIAEEDNAD